MTGRRGARRVKFLGDTLEESSRTNSRLRGRALVRLGRLHPDRERQRNRRGDTTPDITEG